MLFPEYCRHIWDAFGTVRNSKLGYSKEGACKKKKKSESETVLAF